MAFLTGPEPGLGPLLDPVTPIDHAAGRSIRATRLSPAPWRFISRETRSGRPRLEQGHRGRRARPRSLRRARPRAIRVARFRTRRRQLSGSPRTRPAHRTAYYNLGVCLGNAQQWKQAADAFRKALAADATRVDAHLGLGIALIRAGSPAKPRNRSIGTSLCSPIMSRRCSRARWPCNKSAGTAKPSSSIARCWRGIRAARKRCPIWWPLLPASGQSLGL